MNNRKTLKCKGCKPLSTKSPSLQKRTLSSNKSTLKNLIQRNNLLQEENIILKQSSFFNPPSSFLKPHPSQLPPQSHCCLILQDKLFHANKTLQETILNLDSESELNKVLESKISEQELQIKRIQHERNNLLDELDKYRFKFQKYVSMEKTISTSKLDSRKMTLDSAEHEKYLKLLEAHSALQEKYQVLEEYITSQNLLEKANQKMNLIERNITKIEQNNEQIMENLSEEYNQFKEDANQYFRVLYNDLKQLTHSGEIRNFESVKQETYRNPDFRCISDKYNIPRVIHDVLGVVFETFEHEINAYERMVAPLLSRLEGRIRKVGKGCEEMKVEASSIGKRSRVDSKKYLGSNKENVNSGNYVQHAFY